MASKNNSWLKHVKHIAAFFTLPQHVEESLSALESSDKICEFFSNISQEYSLIDTDTLPTHVKAKLDNDPCYHTHLADHVVFDGLKKGKKTL